MTIQSELTAFYHKVGFTSHSQQDRFAVPVYVGCLLVPLPNIETRHKYLKYHDLHHMINNYSVGRIGEGEVSAWELGTGSFWQSPLLGVMNLIALSTGLILRPKRMWTAFIKGRHCQNLYSIKMRQAIDNDQWQSVEALKQDIVYVKDDKTPKAIRAIEFFIYAIVSMFIHVVIAFPALIFYRCLNYVINKDIVQAVNPPKRKDLY